MTDCTTEQIRAAHQADSRTTFQRSFDELILKVNFESEAESIATAENIEITRKAYGCFLKQNKWQLASWCYEDLLSEKSGDHGFRADKAVPNWYHEFRQILGYMSTVRKGLIAESDLAPYGGLEVANGTLLRHDSWEDLGNRASNIYASLEGKILSLDQNNELDEGQWRILCRRSVMIMDGVDLLTRKAPLIDDEGNFVYKENSDKYVKIPRSFINKNDQWDSSLNEYFNRLLTNPHAIFSKFFDAIEGMSTRVGVNTFSTEVNKDYLNERRQLFGHRGTDKQAVRAFPFLKDGIQAADSTLGILLGCMETVLYYTGSGQNPASAPPIDIDKYLPYATQGFDLLPRAFHPICIFLERMETEAKKPEHGRMYKDLLSHVLYPSLLPHFPKPDNYVNRTLPELPSYVPNVS